MSSVRVDGFCATQNKNIPKQQEADKFKDDVCDALDIPMHRIEYDDTVPQSDLLKKRPVNISPDAFMSLDFTITYMKRIPLVYFQHKFLQSVFCRMLPTFLLI